MLTLNAPITTAADDKFLQFPKETRLNIFDVNRLPADDSNEILSLFWFPKEPANFENVVCCKNIGGILKVKSNALPVLCRGAVFGKEDGALS